MWTVIFLWIYVCCLLRLLSFSLFKKFFWSKMLLNKIVLHKVAIFCLKQCCYWYPMLQNCVSCVSTNCISSYFWCHFKRLIQIKMQFIMIRNKQLWTTESLYSSVAEHWSCKPGVVSSNLTGGIVFFHLSKSPCFRLFFSLCRNHYNVMYIT